MSHLLGNAGFLDCAGAIAAADHGRGAGIGQQLGHGKSAFGKLGHLEDAHRAVPDDQLCALKGGFERLDGFRADVHDAPAGRDLVHIHDLAVGFGLELIGDHRIHRQEQSTAGFRQDDFAVSIEPASTRLSCMLQPLAARKVLAMPPPMMSLSHLASRFSTTAILSLILAPPRMAIYGCSGLEVARPRYSSSFSIRKPETAGRKRATPSVEARVRVCNQPHL